MSRKLLFVLAVACGVGVANAYFPQAVVPLLVRSLGVGPAAAAFVATAAQLGYALGIFLLVPLGDRLPRKPLVAAMFGVVSVGLVLAGTATSLPALCVFGAVVGAATVVPQILIPMAADLSGAGSARAVATLQGGLLGGVLLARAFGGLVGQWLGWRAPYLIAGGLAIILAGVLIVALPPDPDRRTDAAPRPSRVRLFRELPDLRRSCLYQALLFGGFSAAWTSIALLLTGPHYRFGTGVVGVVALVGAASVATVPAAGRMIERRGPDPVSRLCFLGVGAAAVVLLGGLSDGVPGLIALVLGLLLLDVCVQSSQVANQVRIFALRPAARSSLNSVYMTAVFLGGSAGSWLGARLYLSFGWIAVCGLLAVAAAGALTASRVRGTGAYAETQVSAG